MCRRFATALLGAMLSSVGCGSQVTVVDSDADSPPGVGTETGDGTSTSTSTSTATGTDTSTSTSTGTHGCWAGSQDDCSLCCAEEHYSESYALNDIFLAQCLCGPDTPCYAECSDVLCVTQTPDLDCEDCIDELVNPDHPCVLAAFAQCAEDPECAPVGACLSGCPDSTGTGTGTVYDECWDQNPSGCLDCCETTYDQALKELTDFFWAACFCDPGAPCQIACDTYCADLSQPADPPCQACMDSLLAAGEDCFGLALDACFAQASCAPVAECLQGC